MGPALAEVVPDGVLLERQAPVSAASRTSAGLASLADAAVAVATIPCSPVCTVGGLLLLHDLAAATVSAAWFAMWFSAT